MVVLPCPYFLPSVPRVPELECLRPLGVEPGRQRGGQDYEAHPPVVQLVHEADEAPRAVLHSRPAWPPPSGRSSGTCGRRRCPGYMVHPVDVRLPPGPNATALPFSHL